MKVLVALGFAVLILSGCSGATNTQSASVDASPVDTSPVAAGPAIGVSDYGVKLKTTKKQCFGSAGCNVEIRLTLAASAQAQGVPAEITVSVKGDESGPIIETISIDENGEYSPVEVSLSTKSSATKITAKVTDVLVGS
jgi:hypothetical protein